MTKIACMLFGLWCPPELPPEAYGVFKGPYDTHCFCGFHTEYCTPDKGYVEACCTVPYRAYDGVLKCEHN